MNNRIIFPMIILLFLSYIMPSYALSQEEMLNIYCRDITKEMPLGEAIDTYNQRYPDANPLTAAEVIAAIRNWDKKRHPVNDATYALYLRVAEERILPCGMYFSRITRLMDFKYAYEVDWKDLTLTSIPEGQKDPEIGFGYNYRIRARYISSRPLTVEEKELFEQRNKRYLEILEKEGGKNEKDIRGEKDCGAFAVLYGTALHRECIGRGTCQESQASINRDADIQD